ncbi:MAG TPA: O-antigen ligase family protein [Solirubrobacteraceae bacterium]|nr:O-antigen ligase family protein [Solirubrobacteraceae bacterium]
MGAASRTPSAGVSAAPPDTLEELVARRRRLIPRRRGREQPSAPEREHERAQPLQLLGWAALAAFAPALLVYLSFNAGGYFPSASGIAAVALTQALVLRTVLAERPFEGFSRALAVPLLALAAYAAWQLASALWSHAYARALDAYDTTLLYVLALALFGAVRCSSARLRTLVRAVFAGLALVCLAGVLSCALPHVWPTASSFYDSRLNYPLTYWNAEGVLAAIALVLGVHLSAERRERAAVRVLAAALLPAIAVTLLLTFSRGALGAAAIALLAYCVLARAHTLPATLLAAAPACALALRSAWDATALASTTPTSAHAVAQGRHLALVLGACMLAAGAARAVLLVLDRRLAGLRPVRRPPRLRVRAGVAALLALLVLALALTLGGAGLARREYRSFVHGNGAAGGTQTRERLSAITNNGRLSLWRAAVRIYRTQPLRGTGAGTYQLYYPRYRSEGLYVTDAHSLYLQSLAEGGVVGLALIAIVVAGLLAGLAARVRGPDRGVYAALLALTLAWAVHQAFDWDWQMPAVTLAVFVLAGLALARPAGRGAALGGLPGSRTLVAIGWLALALAPLLASLSYGDLHRASHELTHGDCAAAKRDALSSLSLSAKRPQAYAIVGVCDLELGLPQQAAGAMQQAAALEPQSWEDEFWLAVARAGAGVDPRAAIARAVALNPLENGLRSAQRRLDGGGARGWERLAPRLRAEALDSGKFQVTSL